MDVLGNFAFVLVRPLQAGNVGSAARALKNMGLGDLRLVAARAGASGRAAAAMAVHAGDVLRNAQRYDSLGAALTDCTLAVGTTCRPGLYRSGVVALREAAVQLAAEAGSSAGILLRPTGKTSAVYAAATRLAAPTCCGRAHDSWRVGTRSFPRPCVALRHGCRVAFGATI